MRDCDRRHIGFLHHCCRGSYSSVDLSRQQLAHRLLHRYLDHNWQRVEPLAEVASFRHSAHFRSANRRQRSDLLGRLDGSNARHEPLWSLALVDLIGHSSEPGGLPLSPGDTRSSQLCDRWHSQRSEPRVGRGGYRTARRPQRLDRENRVVDTPWHTTRIRNVEFTGALPRQHL